MNATLCFALFDTPIGTCAIAWSGRGIAGLQLPEPTAAATRARVKRRWPGVVEAAVVGLPDPRWGEVPVLVLVACPGAVLDLAGLQACLVQQLARYKQPRRVVVVAGLPKTALGKVQKSLLRESLLSVGGIAAD